MSPFAAVIGAGEVGGATAQAVAALDCVSELRLIDATPGIAAGKALDLTQSAATAQHSTRVVGTADVRSAAGAAVIVLADAFGTASGEWRGEEGLALVRRVWEFASTDRTVIVCAGAHGGPLIRSAIRELHVDRKRIVGTAPAAFEAAGRALVGIALDGNGSEVGLMVLGDPPMAAVPCWSQATVSGAALTARLSAAQLHAIDVRLPNLWPPGAYALGAAAARAVRAVTQRSRSELTVFVALDGEMGMRNLVRALPVRLGPAGVERIVELQLTPQEDTRLRSRL